MKRHSVLLALCLPLAALFPLHAQQFGGSLAISGDQVLVGETGSQPFPGFVYVFQRAISADVCAAVGCYAVRAAARPACSEVPGRASQEDAFFLAGVG